jgi:hypothetical protein
LRGFASIAILLGDDPHPKFVMHGITVHTHASGAAWALAPSQAVVRDGELVKDPATGKTAYGPPLLEFNSKDERRRWSDAVIKAVLRFDASALQCREVA